MSGTITRVAQGTINRLRGSLTFPGLTGMNITASYLGTKMIQMTMTGDSAMLLLTSTGAAKSPEPYREVELEVNLITSQALAFAWQQQELTNSLISGGATLRTAATSPGVSLYTFDTVIIRGIRNLSTDGKSVDYMLRFGCLWYINSTLWT
jgi:hypothetical protein